ncbi:uncharacterized protein F4812DRAFT_323070 [Daldinia caldariorum]|uniref:uncharacterized protein n=1 Tax=Daldinia caldariorum TaxID=326644 RepID=UPI0020088DE1|nr:uncharacterized protein F4812DRAFT_323070 [Daldinia caldariorum]KAI1469232.1 hypothetical protein F4812DRAFT_323070 [Daldinia caldariorum]
MKSVVLLIAAAAKLASVYAQTQTTGGDEPTSAQSNEAVTHTVRVGLQHDFSPDTIHANPGDTIRFNFYPRNHSVVRAAFKKPCIPWELTNGPAETFFSGPIEQDTLESPIPSWDLQVDSTDPVFFYCSAPGSCIDWKMVGVINPNETFTLDIQKAFVQNATFQLSPGEQFPDESSPSSTAGSGNNSPTSTPGASSDNSSGRATLSSGAIAGIAIGGVAAIAIIAALVYLCGRKGGIEKGYRRSTLINTAPPQVVEANYNDYGPKSPAIGSPYPPSYVDPYRAASPGAMVSPVGSPHNSYLGHPSPGYPAYAPVSPTFPKQDQPALYEAPADTQPSAVAELPGSIDNVHAR